MRKVRLWFSTKFAYICMRTASAFIKHGSRRRHFLEVDGKGIELVGEDAALIFEIGREADDQQWFRKKLVVDGGELVEPLYIGFGTPDSDTVVLILDSVTIFLIWLFISSAVSFLFRSGHNVWYPLPLESVSFFFSTARHSATSKPSSTSDRNSSSGNAASLLSVCYDVQCQKEFQWKILLDLLSLCRRHRR